MKIELKDTYKSLRAFESENLSEMAIITGRNGSGKSQLLNLLHGKSKNVAALASVRLEINPKIEKIQFEGIVKDDSLSVDHEHWKEIVSRNLQLYKGLSHTQKKLIDYISFNKLNDKAYANQKKLGSKLIDNSIEYRTLIAKIDSELNSTPLLELKNVSPIFERRVLRRIHNPANEQLSKLITEICKISGKLENEISDVDFYNTPIPESLIDVDDLFSSKIELIFYNYAKRRDHNRKEWFYKNEDSEENNSISDADFIQTNIPPWQLINEILSYHNIDFYFKGIEKKEFTLDVPLDFKLLKKSTDEIIVFNDLSSGEKVIIGLILKLFTSEYYNQNLKFPELLILDEPDAHLHPEMSRMLLEVLKNTFVHKYGIKVIITTHSPSTIALADENEIYQLTNGVNTSLKKISKDEALEILTSFIPTLSINYKNHKQVFVESPTDRFYYQTIFDRMNQEKKYPSKLYIISNGYGKGNSSQVEEIVGAIRNSDNKTCFGIIDWDKKKKSSNYVKVHGEGQRYSIENYVFDPLYLVSLFLETASNNCHKELGLEVSFNQYYIGLDNQLAKKAVEWFFEKYYSKFRISEPDKSDIRQVKYYNGLELDIPIWYLEFQGHDLEIKLKEVFKSLESFRNEGDLQKRLTVISAKSFPVIPMDTVELIESIV